MSRFVLAPDGKSQFFPHSRSLVLGSLDSGGELLSASLLLIKGSAGFIPRESHGLDLLALHAHIGRPGFELFFKSLDAMLESVNLFGVVSKFFSGLCLATAGCLQLQLEGSDGFCELRCLVSRVTEMPGLGIEFFLNACALLLFVLEVALSLAEKPFSLVQFGLGAFETLANLTHVTTCANLAALRGLEVCSEGFTLRLFCFEGLLRAGSTFALFRKLVLKHVAIPL